ncbi:hypothetical protein BBK82_17520 [Lentzea guizhouensis]|uniref:Uncharacterized protein n=1 Tax=Lentzea guizhouensis TaxID=1586287 RepID=A0A1B2HIM5_9PSEU|nr:hypothetical protein [Lentzea guizhouensis]ANZ37578.1 hypothetical protein BBK82_17520 [Lentzea guizhouensis]
MLTLRTASAAGTWSVPKSWSPDSAEPARGTGRAPRRSTEEPKSSPDGGGERAGSSRYLEMQIVVGGLS